MSWWTEDGVRKQINIKYRVHDKEFEISLDGNPHVYMISNLSDGTGQAVEVWDLFVGASINVLGRKTTLRQCSVHTRQFLTAQTERFIKHRDDLLEHLNKYEVASVDQYKTAKDPVRTNFRGLFEEIEQLTARLAKYRPRIAKRYALDQL